MEDRHSLSEPRLVDTTDPTTNDNDSGGNQLMWEVDIYRKGVADPVATIELSEQNLPPRTNKKGKILWRLPSDSNRLPSFGTDEKRRILELFKDRKKSRRKKQNGSATATSTSSTTSSTSATNGATTASTSSAATHGTESTASVPEASPSANGTAINTAINSSTTADNRDDLVTTKSNASSGTSSNTATIGNTSNNGKAKKKTSLKKKKKKEKQQHQQLPEEEGNSEENASGNSSTNNDSSSSITLDSGGGGSKEITRATPTTQHTTATASPSIPPHGLPPGFEKPLSPPSKAPSPLPSTHRNNGIGTTTPTPQQPQQRPLQNINTRASAPPQISCYIIIPERDRPPITTTSTITSPPKQPSLAIPAARAFIDLYYSHITHGLSSILAQYYTPHGQKSVSVGGAHSVVANRSDIIVQLSSISGSVFVVRGVVAQDAFDGKGVHVLVTGLVQTAEATGGNAAFSPFAHSISLVPAMVVGAGEGEERKVEIVPYAFQIHNDALSLLTIGDMTAPAPPGPMPSQQQPSWNDPTPPVHQQQQQQQQQQPYQGACHQHHHQQQHRVPPGY